MAFVTCPYCNAPLPAATSAVGRQSCPRCGETLPAQATAAPGEIAPTNNPSPPETLVSPPPFGLSNRRLAVVILATMCVVGLVGLAFALYTTPGRRALRVPGKINPTEESVIPTESIGVGFMPPNVNLVAAFNIQEIMKSSATKTLFDAPRPAVIDFVVRLIKQRTTLELKDVSRIALGAELTDKLPQLQLVIETVRPINTQLLARQMPGDKAATYRGKPLYHFNLQPVGAGVLWLPEDRVCVLVLRVESVTTADLDAIPLAPRNKEEALPNPLRSLGKRVDPQSYAWALGSVEHSEALNALIGTLGLAGNGDELTKVRAVVLNVVGGQNITVNGQLNARTSEDAFALKTSLKNLDVPQASVIRVEGPPPEAKLPDDLWVLWQMRMDVPALRRLLVRSPTK